MAATKATTFTYTYDAATKNKQRFTCSDVNAPTNAVYLAKDDKRAQGKLEGKTLTLTLV